MKSKISLFNKAVWKRNLTGCWGLWAGLLAFYFMMLPVSIYGSLADARGYYAAPDAGELLVMRVNVLVGRIWQMRTFVPFFAGAALVCAMFLFSYLFTGRNSNMMHTYPVSRMSLFVTNYVTGLQFLLVPLVLAAAVSMAVGAGFGALNGAVVKSYLIWIGTACVENMFFFSMAVCVLMFVGNIIAVPILYLILNFLFLGCMMIAEAMIWVVCYGMREFDISQGGMRAVLTPIIYLTRIGNTGSQLRSDFDYTYRNVQALPGYLAAAVLFAVLALAVYHKKHIETAGDVITVGWLKPIFRWGVAVCTSALGALFFSQMLFMTDSFPVILATVVVIGILVFFIVQMLLERSVHVFTKKRVREGIIYTALICACYIGLDADVLGIERKIPPMDEIQAVRTSGYLNLMAVDGEAIAWVREAHSEIIASKKEFERLADRKAGGYYLPSYYLSVTYYLKDGTTLSRGYQIQDTGAADSVFYRVQDYSRQPEVILKQYFGIHYPDIEIYGATWRNYSTAVGEEIRIPEKYAKKLYAAFVQDVQAGHAGPVELDDGSTISTINTDDSYGRLVLNVRDEAGFYSTSGSLYSDIGRYLDGTLSKDGEVYIEVDKRFTHFSQVMEQLGYGLE